MRRPQSAGRIVFLLAAIVVVIAGLRAAKSLIVPFLLAGFLVVLLTPIVRWLRRRGLPVLVAIFVVVLVVFSVGAGVVALVGGSVNNFYRKLPVYQELLRERVVQHEEWLAGVGVRLPDALRHADPRMAADGVGEIEKAEHDLLVDGDLGLQLVRRLLGELASITSSAVVLLVTVILMLLEAIRFPAKLDAILPPDSPTRHHLAVILANVRRYMGIKTATSLLTGVLVATFLTVVGIEDALLWGLMAFLFNYVPNIGSILAAIPAVLLAFLDHGTPTALVTASGYLVINCLISYAIEPRYMGQGLGLSTLIVFLSLVFWGWVLGPVGMLLSAPLTMIAKIVMNDYPDTRWLAVLIGSKAPESDAKGDEKSVAGNGELKTEIE